MADRGKCPKCGATSGDDWAQCGGRCPMEQSPHYSASLDAGLVMRTKRWPDNRANVANRFHESETGEPRFPTKEQERRAKRAAREAAYEAERVAQQTRFDEHEATQLANSISDCISDSTISGLADAVKYLLRRAAEEDLK
jgi:hypothetical protein